MLYKEINVLTQFIKLHWRNILREFPPARLVENMNARCKQ